MTDLELPAEEKEEVEEALESLYEAMDEGTGFKHERQLTPQRGWWLLGL